MTPTRKVIWMVLVICLVSLPTLGRTVSAPHEIPQFKHLSERDGLPHGGVNCIIQDSRGFMWFGSQGLCKYDGYRIKVYKPKLKAMRYDVRTIHEDREGILWVGTFGAGIARFDPLTEQFTVYQHDPNDSNSLSHPEATTICEDSDGVLWIGTQWEGLNRFDRATETFVRYGHSRSDPNNLNNRVVESVYEDRTGRLWVGTQGGLDLLDRSTGRFTRYRHDPADPHSLSRNMLNGTIWEDRDGHLWVGTAEDVVNHFDPNSGTFSRFPLDPNSSVPGSNFVSAICQDRVGQIWIGTRRGLWKRDPDHGALHYFRHDPARPSSLSDDHIQCIYEDRSGLIWVGTATGGVDRFDPARKPLTVYRHDPKNAEGLSHNQVGAISEDHQGTLWIGTFGGGLNSLDQVTGRWLCYLSDPSDLHSLGNPSVWAVNASATEPGPVWIGAKSSGLYRFDRTIGQFTHLSYNPTDWSGLFYRIVSLFKDRENTLWIGTRRGLCWLDSSTKKFGHYRPDLSDPHRPIPVDIRAIHEDQFGVLWVGSFGDGLYSLDRATDRFSCYRSDVNDPHTLSNDSVQIIHEDSRGILWIGTRDGLSRFERRTKSFTRFLGVNHPVGEEDWQPHNSIRGIVEDDAGDLWVSTGRGIYVLSEVSNSGFRIRYHESLAGHWLGNFYRGACLKSSRGDLFFGSDNGLFAFHPQKMRDSDPPPVVLTELKLNGESVPIRADGSTPLVRHISASEEITLCRDMRIFTLEFAAIDFRDPEQNQYAYMLEGFVDDWVYQGNDRSATFSNLDPGEYVFRVKAANSNGVWNEASTSLRLIITPLWWETTWFRVLVVALIIGGIVGGYEGRVQLVKVHRRSLEAKVAERTKQLQFARDDISERKANEVAILREKQFTEATINGLPGIFYLYDSEWRMVRWNQNHESLTGFSADELKGRKLLDWFSEDYKGIVASAVKKVFEEGEATVDAPLTIKDGRQVPFLFKGTRLEAAGKAYLIGMGIDISQLKANEEALEKSEHQLRLITDSLPALIAHIDSDQRYIFVNKSYANFVGLPRDQIVGKYIRDVLGENTFELIRERVETVLLGQSVTFEITMSPSGSELHHMLTMYVPDFREGDIQGFFASIHDVTDLEKAKKQARDAHMTLYHFGRVKMLEALSSSLSHEMQQPLTGVLSNAQAIEMLLEDPQPDMDEVKCTVKDIVADAKRAGGVMWQLRAFLRKQDTNLQLLNLNSLIEEILNVLNSDMVIHKILVVRHLAADLPEVMGDDVQLKQVLINLIMNAQQAMEESVSEVRRLVVRTSVVGTGKIAVCIEDSGSGIEEGEFEHIFEPFFTTRQEGTGMGLPISRFIIEAHGGQMWAENQAEGGAKVGFSLPAAGGSFES